MNPEEKEKDKKRRRVVSDNNVVNVKEKENENAKPYVLVLDTETTGLAPRNGDPQAYNLYNGARMIEIAWEKRALDGTFHSRESYLIAPMGFSIPSAATNVHGISTEEAVAQGHAIEFVWDKLLAALENVVVLVAHNMEFDNAIIMSEMYRYAQVVAPTKGTTTHISRLLNVWNGIKKECTMRIGAAKLNNGKWPKLATLHALCFNVPPDGTLHRAAEDTAICARIYFHLAKL